MSQRKGGAPAMVFAGSASQQMAITAPLEQIADKINEAFGAGAAHMRANYDTLTGDLRYREEIIRERDKEIARLQDKVRELSEVVVQVKRAELDADVRKTRIEAEQKQNEKLIGLFQKPMDHYLKGGGGQSKHAAAARASLARLFEERPDLCAEAQTQLGAKGWLAVVDFVTEG